MNVDDQQKLLLTALKVLNWRAAGAGKFVATTEVDDLEVDFLDEMRREVSAAADRTSQAFCDLADAVRAKARQTRVAEFTTPRRIGAGGEILDTEES